jgi:hypothetical protein
MSQSITFDSRHVHTRTDLDGTTGESLAPAQGDFARGQRHHFAPGRANCDFATGMRNLSKPRVSGDFATGMCTSPRTTTLGDFATGMRTGVAPAAVDALPSAVGALPVAA